LANFVAQIADQAGEDGAREIMLTDQIGARDAGAPPVKQAVSR
jgi:hypothetical protein